MDQIIRTFIAIPLPDTIKNNIESIQKSLKKQKINARWVLPESIHLTLKFLGHIHQEKLPLVNDILTTCGDNCTEFSLQLKGIGVFPNYQRPRIIWLGLTGDLTILKDLQLRIEQTIEEQLGIPQENRPFKPHITIGRIKDHGKHASFISTISSFESFSTECFVCNELILFQSTLNPKGAVYTPLQIKSFQAIQA